MERAEEIKEGKKRLKGQNSELGKKGRFSLLNGVQERENRTKKTV